jgi:hypothetical protein
VSTRTKPKRIQRKRTRGYKLPKDAVYVGRPTKWGNPFRAGRDACGRWGIYLCERPEYALMGKSSEREAKAGAVRLYRAYLDNDGSQACAIRDSGGAFLKVLAKEELKGKQLACWCREGEPCHADVLLEIANA